jgi:hypothetical protein
MFKIDNNSNRQIVENGKIETPNKHIHEHPLSWLCTGTSIISVCAGGGVGFEGEYTVIVVLDITLGVYK